MPYQKVHVKISKETGKMSIEGDGFVGQQCDVLDQVETQLGTVQTRTDKSEKFQYVQPDYLPNQLG